MLLCMSSCNILSWLQTVHFNIKKNPFISIELPTLIRYWDLIGLLRFPKHKNPHWVRSWMAVNTSKSSALLVTQSMDYQYIKYTPYYTWHFEFQYSQHFFLLKELLFSFQLFEEGKVEEAVLHAAHSPKVSNTLSFVITVSTLSHLTFCFVFGYGIVW